MLSTSSSIIELTRVALHQHTNNAALTLDYPVLGAAEVAADVAAVPPTPPVPVPVDIYK